MDLNVNKILLARSSYQQSISEKINQISYLLLKPQKSKKEINAQIETDEKELQIIDIELQNSKNKLQKLHEEYSHLHSLIAPNNQNYQNESIDDKEKDLARLADINILRQKLINIKTQYKVMFEYNKKILIIINEQNDEKKYLEKNLSDLENFINEAKFWNEPSEEELKIIQQNNEINQLEKEIKNLQSILIKCNQNKSINQIRFDQLKRLSTKKEKDPVRNNLIVKYNNRNNNNKNHLKNRSFNFRNKTKISFSLDNSKCYNSNTSLKDLKINKNKRFNFSNSIKLNNNFINKSGECNINNIGHKKLGSSNTNLSNSFCHKIENSSNVNRESILKDSSFKKQKNLRSLFSQLQYDPKNIIIDQNKDKINTRENEDNPKKEELQNKIDNNNYTVKLDKKEEICLNPINNIKIIKNEEKNNKEFGWFEEVNTKHKNSDNKDEQRTNFDNNIQKNIDIIEEEKKDSGVTNINDDLPGLSRRRKPFSFAFNK